LTITKLATTLSLDPGSVAVPTGTDSGLVATLTAAGLPLREKSVYLDIRDGPDQVVDAVVGASDLQGEVELGATQLPAGSYAVTASFGAEAVDLGQSTVNATDPDYGSSTATATLVIEGTGGSAPVAVRPGQLPDPRGQALVVPAPGVLGNDTDADGGPLSAAVTSGPTSGSLALNADGSLTYTPTADFVGSATFTYAASDGKQVKRFHVGGLVEPRCSRRIPLAERRCSTLFTVGRVAPARPAKSSWVSGTDTSGASDR